jgi:8-oxo-dGTP diphosphatase
VVSYGTAPAPDLPIHLARWVVVRTERPMKVIVGAAIIADGSVLACARAHPPELAGLWEFPGGKVEPGETEVEALVRECDEELGVRVEVGARIGGDIRLGRRRTVLRVYLARLADGSAEPRAIEHGDVRWLGVDALDSVPWLPADAPIVAALRDGPWMRRPPRPRI